LLQYAQTPVALPPRALCATPKEQSAVSAPSAFLTKTTPSQAADNFSICLSSRLTRHRSPSSILREVFGYDAFRGQQQAIIEHVTAGGDALVLMPTGGGKSCVTRSRPSPASARGWA
jgi:superfamily II DNA helicase RecQ